MISLTAPDVDHTLAAVVDADAATAAVEAQLVAEAVGHCHEVGVNRPVHNWTLHRGYNTFQHREATNTIPVSQGLVIHSSKSLWKCLGLVSP